MSSTYASCSFSEPLANSRDYPPVLFPASPVSQDAGRSTIVHRDLPIGASWVIGTPRARYGIALSARALLPRGALVLVPAYHCPAMIEPLLWAGCRVAFYHMTRDLAPEPGSFRHQLEAADAVLLTRYFGFESAVGDCAALARDAGKLVIEDLAHAAFATHLTGDVAVTSLGKFFPCVEGAELFIADHEHYRRVTSTLKVLRTPKAAWKARSVMRRLRRRLGNRKPTSEFRYFDTQQMSRPANDTLNIGSGGLSEAEIAQHRRTNYLRLEQLVASTLPAGMVCGPLPEGLVPYVFPLLLPNASGFHSLRQAGIPIQRWEELAETNCAISSDYRQRLVQLPVHQAMTATQVTHVVETLDRLIGDGQQRSLE